VELYFHSPNTPPWHGAQLVKLVKFNRISKPDLKKIAVLHYSKNVSCWIHVHKVTILVCFSAWSRSFTRRLGAALDSWAPSRFASVEEIFSVRKKVDFVLWLAELKSYTRVRRKINQVYLNQTTLIYRSGVRWGKRLKEVGSVMRQYEPPWQSERRCLSWEGANMNELREKKNCQSCQVLYQWNACQYLARKWIVSWHMLCHYWWPYWDLMNT
jgi:hypothetical protein